MTPSLSIVIPARNEEQCLPTCIDHIRSATHGDKAEIIVSLNRCTDKSESIALEKNCRVVHEDAKNLSIIRNAGAAVASGDILITLDADSFIHHKFLSNVINTMMSQKYIGGGVLLLPERWSLGIVATGLCVGTLLLWHRISVGSFFLFRRDYEELGGFDESYVSVEDIDFAVRLKRLGKERGMQFAHLLKTPITTSCRKFDTLGDWYFFKNPRLAISLLRGKNKQGANDFWYDFPR